MAPTACRRARLWPEGGCRKGYSHPATEANPRRNRSDSAVFPPPFPRPVRRSAKAQNGMSSAPLTYFATTFFGPAFSNSISSLSPSIPVIAP